MNIDEISEVFSVTLRIKIIAALISGEKTFNELLELTKATRGNLSVQLTKMEEWDFVASKKIIENKRTKSTYKLTAYGLSQFEDYVAALGAIIRGPV